MHSHPVLSLMYLADVDEGLVRVLSLSAAFEQHVPF